MAGDDLQVRPLVVGDDDDVVAVLLSSGLFEPGDEPGLRALVAGHAAAAEGLGQRWLVATGAASAGVVGTVMYRPVEAADRVWDLTMIAVRGEGQGRGVGHRLMGHVERDLHAQGQRRIVVQTSGLERFAATRRFYRQLGYVECGRVPDYWAEGDAMVLFSKDIAGPPAAQTAPSAPHGSPADRPPVGFTVRLASLEELTGLRSLWLQLHHHHQAGLPDFRGFVTDDERSWSVRFATYRGLLERGHGFVLVAVLEDRIVGYSAVEYTDGAADTFEVGEPYAEVLTLVVDEAHRGRGVGSLLLDAVDEHLAGLGVVGLSISVMHGNDAARRLYERRGLVPTETYLWRTADQKRGPASGGPM